ncbi:hypothetical protein [Synechococcus sp. CBW1107]|uniref:hypothetical protein n=1 Tax=Synechococcus sp. CBW1107 TaxID=2789857 RepID=UPI002AD403FA|nr:hypothetical protein [Synechococcus sp. CBW1107]
MIKPLARAEPQRQARVEQACTLAKQRDLKTCQITLRDRNKEGKVNLEADHLDLKQRHKNLGSSVDNPITLCSEAHDQYHGWNDGTNKLCLARMATVE